MIKLTIQAEGTENEFQITVSWPNDAPIILLLDIQKLMGKDLI